MASTVPEFGPAPVADGVWAITLPAPSIFFKHSIAYLIATKAGPVLIDTGEASDESWDILERSVGKIGFAMSDIHAILLTHSHYDHCGAADRIRSGSGAWIGMSAAEEEFLHAHPDEPGTRALIHRMCVAAGAATEELPGLPPPGSLHAANLIIPDVRIQDGQQFDFGDWTIEVLMTPGHSPGHAAFLAQDRGILFGGDHLFAAGSTVVLLLDGPGGETADPFGDYLCSLDRCDRADVQLVLPGHLGGFTNLAERVTVERRRYEERLATTAAALGSEALEPIDIARSLRWGKGSWQELAPGVRQLAIMNTLASLRALQVRGVARAIDGERTRFQAA